MTKQLVGFGAAVMATLLALVVLWQFQIVIIYVMISLTLAAALRPLTNRLAGQGIVVRAAWILLYGVILVSIGFFLFRTVEIAINEVQLLAHSAPVQDEWRLPVWLEGSLFQQELVARLPPPSKLFSAVTGSQGQLVLPAIYSFTQGIGGILSGVFIILLLSIYWSVGHAQFERFWLSLLPVGQRKQVRSIWQTIESEIGVYTRSQLSQSLLAGLLLGLGYWLLGSPYPVLLALAGALAYLIPVVGPALAIIPPLLVGLLTSMQLSLITVLYALVVLIFLSLWVKPRLVNRDWDNPILTVVLLILLAEAFGLVGIIVAPPLSVVCQILWISLVSHRAAMGAAAQVSDLKERQECLWAVVREMDGPPLPLMTSSMERLAQLITKAEPMLQSTLPVEPSASLLEAV